MVTTKESFLLTVGFVDPATGQYSDYKSFNTANFGTAPLKLAFSPDFSKLAVQKPMNSTQHAGWIDADGVFTDVNADVPFDPFAAKVFFTVIGFDGKGDFFYEKHTDARAAEVFRVAAGSTGPATPITTTVELPGRHLLADGTIDLNGTTPCIPLDNENYNWLSPNEFLVAGGSSTLDLVRPSADCEDRVNLMPSTSEVKVAGPMPKSDGHTVAFIGEVPTGLTIFTVDARSPGGQPKQLCIPKGLPSDNSLFHRWVE